MDLPETRVGAGILISGRIEGEGNVVIEGRVDGEINIRGDLHVDVGGQVKASVHARNIFVMGIMVGNAHAVDKIEIAEGGRMIGDIRAPRVLINEGAAFSGMVDMPDFEGAEDRTGDNRPLIRRAPRPEATTNLAARGNSSPAPRPQTPAPRPQVPSPARPSTQVVTSSSGRPSSGSLYNPPPLPRPPEFAGVRKAIIIKKKSPAEG